jgi:predicted O-methyltransferase YrrM
LFNFVKGESMRKNLLKIIVIHAVLVFVILTYPVEGYTQHEHKEHPASEQRFDDIDRWVRLFEDPERDEWQKPAEVVKRLNLKEGYVIADIGAGTGYFTRLFAEAVGPSGKALGLDVEPSMVKYMKEDARKLELKNYEARIVRADDPGLKPGSVDVVFICNTYHHIEQRVDYLTRLSRGLKTEGRVVIVDFYKNSPVGPQAPGHKVAENIVLQEFQRAGYHLLQSHKILPYQYFLEFALKDNSSSALSATETEQRILSVLEDLSKFRRQMANVPAEDGKLLRLLAETNRARHIVEIGTSNGYSALWFTLALINTGGTLTTFEIDPQRVLIARENFRRAGVDSIVTVVEGNAHEEVMKLKEPIDIVFLDADKSGYLDYLNKLLPLVRARGLVIAHNMSFPSPDPEYIKAITTNPNLETVFLHMDGPGIGVTLKKR